MAMTHDIINNRNGKLVDHISLILDSTQKVRFTVGYFFLSGFQGIATATGGGAAIVDRQYDHP